MKSSRTLARPYAKAIFELAREENALENWSAMLSFLSHVTSNKDIVGICHDPHYAPKELAAVFIDLLKKAKLDNKFIENFIFLLSEYRRLLLLPTIAVMYEESKAELEKTIRVLVTSAFMISDALKIKLKKALEIRLQREVELSFAENKLLIGGAVIRAGDLVIDASVKSKLEKLRNSVCH